VQAKPRVARPFTECYAWNNQRNVRKGESGYMSSMPLPNRLGEVRVLLHNIHYFNLSLGYLK